jgi:hypothetical protein
VGEREVAALLQGWWRQLEPEAVFIRSPLSGGWVQGRDLFDARGDLLVKNAPRFPWVVECKRREAWDLQNFEDGRPTAVWKWWLQAARDADKAGRRPMLWFRQNLRPWVVLVPAELGKITWKSAPDFSWPSGLPGLETKRANAAWQPPHPMGYWADKLLATHPRRWALVV